MAGKGHGVEPRVTWNENVRQAGDTTPACDEAKAGDTCEQRHPATKHHASLRRPSLVAPHTLSEGASHALSGVSHAIHNIEATAGKKMYNAAAMLHHHSSKTLNVLAESVLVRGQSTEGRMEFTCSVSRQKVHVGCQFLHEKHGLGTLTEIMPNGDQCISFVNGEMHTYQPKSLYKLRPITDIAKARL